MSDRHEPQGFWPVPETREAFDWLNRFGEGEVEESMMRMSRRVRQIAPHCVAMSLSVVDGDLTFTIQADRRGATLLDAVQYLDGGPCLQAVEERVIATTANLPLDEGRWQLFARAEALAGISSTLSLPILARDRVVGGVNLYGETADAFDHHLEEIAAACGAWAAGAVTNADLGFTSRLRAAATPSRLFDSGDVELAKGLVAEVSGIDTDEAGSRIAAAAARAGVSESELAQFLLQAHAGDIDSAAEDDRTG